ncbi:MAG: phytanoyl-CoA dioxygenase family protein [Phycisphaeraceae bacterium]
MSSDDIASAVECDGFVSVQHAIELPIVASLITAIETISPATHGMRNLFEHVPDVLGLVSNDAVSSLVSRVLGQDAFAVRAILFDKIMGSNWHVGWHQDQAIAIRQRIDAPGFGPTSIKHGVPHARASRQVLEQMLAVRIHLDHCGPDNGPLRCVPGSHRLGRLDPRQTLEHKQRLGETTCTVAKGGLLLMRPLCLHASSPAKSPHHRRVIHIEFANCELPEPMQWHERHPIITGSV